MTNIFVSCQSIDSEYTSILVRKLREEGFHVNHSPQNPLDGYDPRWRDWYERGLDEALDSTNIFIIVIDYGWDASTWMAQEADSALKRFERGQIREMYYLNPDNTNIHAGGMLRYLKQQLPDDFDTLVEVLKGSIGTSA